VKTREIIAVILLFIFILMILDILIILTLWVIIARRIFHSEKIVVAGDKRYVFIEKSDVIINTRRIKDFTFSGGDGFIDISPVPDGSSNITILGSNPKYKGYAWDGCSPKFQILDLIFGTPDGAISENTGKAVTYYASMVHDVLYQFHDEFGKKISRKQVDLIFIDELEKGQFIPARMYYLMVRALGGIYWRK
jgi:hypothetical protein